MQINAACNVAKFARLTYYVYCRSLSVAYALYLQPFTNGVFGVSDLATICIHFVEPGVKVTGRYYREVPLMLER